MANEARIRQVVDTILNDPASFNMSSWAEKTLCGTTMCIAGHAVNNEGYQMVFDVYGTTNKACIAEGTPVLIYSTAMNLLELSEDEAQKMFLYTRYCSTKGRIIDYADDQCYAGDIPCSHTAATVRQVIENITRITGFEFKIPDHIE